MTISTQNNQITAYGNNSTYTFDFNFVCDTASAVVVFYTNNGITITLPNTAYTLLLNPPANDSLWGIGGVLTYPLTGNPIPNGSYLTIMRILPFQQLTSLGNQSNYYPDAIETALDTLCMLIQQVSARTGQFLGTWVTNYTYTVGSIVVDGVNGGNTGNYYMCAVPNTSGVWATDLANGDWVLAINVQIIFSYVTAAAASATAAAASAVAAGSTFTATSTTSNTIGTGNFTFATQANKNFIMGQPIIASSAANPTNYISGYVNSYSGTTLVITEQSSGGSGAHTDWNIGVTGQTGASGGGTGTVTTASVVSANGFAGSVANPTTTPAITVSTSVTGVLKGNGTAISAAAAGTDYVSPTGSGAGLTNLTAANIAAGTAGINISGNAATVTALTGQVANGTNTSVSGSGTTGAPYEVNVATATNSVLGVSRPDGTSITQSGGVYSANTPLMTALGIGAVAQVYNNTGSTISAGSTFHSTTGSDIYAVDSSGTIGAGSGDVLVGQTWRALQKVQTGQFASWQRIS